MNNRVKSLKIRDEVIKLIEEKFNVRFSYSFNDLYKVKDNDLVRRLKGGINIFYLSDWRFNKEKIKEFNDLVLNIDNFVKELNYEDFKIRFKKKMIGGYCLESVRNNYDFLKYSSEKEIKDYLKDIEGNIILSIRFKDI